MPGLEPPREASEQTSEQSPLLEPIVPKAKLFSHISVFSDWRPLFIVIAFTIFGTVAHIVSSKYTWPGFYGQYGADRWVLTMLPNQTNGFFLDIGAYDGEKFSNSKLLEQNGWRGVCADPFPRNFQNRGCKVVTGPVGPLSGAKEKMADCSEGASGFLHHMMGDDMLSGVKRYTSAFQKKVASCPEREMSTVGISDLLASGKAPRVIDYVNLDTEGAELHILQGFPFDRHCVRTWTIEHNCEEPKKTKIKELLESQGCRVEQVMIDWWAVCPCWLERGEQGQSLAAGEVKGRASAFDRALRSKNFFPEGKRPWSGRIATCRNNITQGADIDGPEGPRYAYKVTKTRSWLWR